MCRLALFNNKGIDYIDKQYGLLKFFDYLEKRLGGHGNGYAIIHNDGTTTIRKGILLKNEQIVEDIYKNKHTIKWLIYHTRLASVGSISDNNCHPFSIDKIILCMNGTEYNAKRYNNFTDTQSIMIKERKNIISGTKKYHSAFIGYDGKKVFCNKNNGSLRFIQDSESIIFASEFPSELKCNIAPIYWVEGQKILKGNLIVNGGLINGSIKWTQYDEMDGYGH